MKRRIFYFDILRALAAFAVVMIHVSAAHFNALSVNDSGWTLSNIFDGSTRWAVPIFVMISGALFLDPKKEVVIKKMYSKNILKMAIVFIFWSFVYVIYNLCIGETSGITDSIVGLIKGYNHLWFIFMLIGLYIATPLLRMITKDKKMLRYYLGLSLLFGIIVPGLVHLIEGGILVSYEVHIDKILGAVNYALGHANLHVFLGYVGYYLLGYYLANNDWPKNKKWVLYAVGVVGAITTVSFTIAYSKMLGGKWNDYDNLSLQVLVQSAALFVLAKSLWGKKTKIGRMIKFISDNSLGLYLVHGMLVDFIMFRLGVANWDGALVLFTIPIITVGVYVVSVLIAWLIGKVPVVGKRIV